MVCFNKLTHCETQSPFPPFGPFYAMHDLARKTHHDKRAAYIILQLIWLTAIVLVHLQRIFRESRRGAAALIHLTQRDIPSSDKLEWIFWTITLTETASNSTSKSWHITRCPNKFWTVVKQKIYKFHERRKNSSKQCSADFTSIWRFFWQFCAFKTCLDTL